MPILSKTNPSLIIALLCLITTLGRFVMDNYLPSLPFISQSIHAPASDIQLTLTLYILGFGLSQLIYGPLSDRFGRKKILMGGLILFLIANTLCSFTQSLTILLVTRLLSGVGMGVCGVLNRAIASDCFSGPAFSKAWSYTTTTLVVVLIVAPLIGSGVQEWLGWRANFAVATLFVGLATFIILWGLPETNHSNKLHAITVKSVIQNYKTILSSRSFIVSTLCYTFVFAGLVAYFQISPFLLMNELHLTPMQYGYTSLAIAIGYLSGGLIVSRLARVLGIRLLLVMGILLVITGGALMISLNYDDPTTVWRVLLPTAVYVLGARIVIPNAMAGAFTGFRHLGGSASGLIGGIQMLGTALVSLIMTHFSDRSPMPLALLFSILGLCSLIAFCYLYFYKNKYLYKHFIQLSVGAIQLYHMQPIQTGLMRLIRYYEISRKKIDYSTRAHKIIKIFMPFIRFGYHGYFQVMNHKMITKFIASLSRKIRRMKLYQYCYSAIQFSLQISDRRRRAAKVSDD
jgi:Bcr/CflA subfamily drug resistance transporter